MNKKEILQNIHIGSRVAEDEQEYLNKYFIQTHAYQQIINDEVDIVYGAKGTGKSAIYLHLIKNQMDFLKKKTIIVQAENAQGASAFKSVVDDPPTSENMFRNIWKLYFLVLLYNTFYKKFRFDKSIRVIKKVLRDSSLISNNRTLIEYFADTYRYIKNGTTAIELGISADANAIPNFSGKIIFSNPSLDMIKNGYVDIETLLNSMNNLLEKSGIQSWIILDRLDSVFESNQALEENAIRGLFKTYLDMRKYSNVRQKIFLRTDIWSKILKKGFREASHITRDVTISWNIESILNLIITRFIENDIIVQEYAITKNEILSNYDNQAGLFYRIFPKQIEKGDRKPNTLNWIIKRTSDAKGVITPREIIHLIIEVINLQILNIDMGKDATEDENLFDRSLFKQGLEKVSKVKMEQTVFAEYSDLKDIIMKFAEQRASNTIQSISRILGINDEDAIKTIAQLQEIGFLEKTDNAGKIYYSIPFLFRPYLKSIQGLAE